MVTVELNKGEKVTISSEDKDLIITVKEFEKFPFKEGDYLVSSEVGGWTWFYVFKEFKNDIIYCYVSILNSDLATTYQSEKVIPFSEIKKTEYMTGPEVRGFASVLKDNGFKWNAKDKIVETVFKPGDVIKNDSSTHYYIVLKILYDDIIVVNELGQESIGHTGNMFQTIEQEADLFFDDLRKNGLEYNATTNTVDKIKWVPAYDIVNQKKF